MQNSKHFFSPSKNAFYADEFRAAYEAAGSWPKDLVEVSFEAFSEFSLKPAPAGKERAFKRNKLVWVDMKPPEVPAEEQRARLVVAVSRMMDQTAKGLGFDNMQSAVTFAEEPAVPRFQELGRALRAWRSHVLERRMEILAKVDAGELAMPSVESLLAELPAFEAPAAA